MLGGHVTCSAKVCGSNPSLYNVILWVLVSLLTQTYNNMHTATATTPAADTKHYDNMHMATATTPTADQLPMGQKHVTCHGEQAFAPPRRETPGQMACSGSEKSAARASQVGRFGC